MRCRVCGDYSEVARDFARLESMAQCRLGNLKNRKYNEINNSKERAENEVGMI